MRTPSTIGMALGLVLALACTYRTELLPGGPPGGGGAQAGGATGTGGGTGGAGGSGPPDNDRSCAIDDECVQCAYALAPSNPAECDRGLGCCGGPVMNQTACATNRAAWDAHCSDRPFIPPHCPCIVPSSNVVTCRSGECGYW